MARPTDHYFADKGKRFDHTALPEDLRWMYETPVSRLDRALADAFEQEGDTKLPFPYHIGYLAHWRLNASAWHLVPSGCAISIYSSVPPLVLMACNQFARRCNSATAMPLDEEGKLAVFETKLPVLTKLPLPVRTERDLLAVLEPHAHTGNLVQPLGLLLTEIALKFIAMHECMHVILGHTKYVQQEFGLRAFLEFSPEKAKKIGSLLSQTLEFISDRHTVRGLLVRLWEKDFDGFHRENLLKQIAIDQDLYLLRCLVHACCILFHLFPGNSKPVRDTGRPYPHPYVRARWLCNEVAQELAGKAIDPYEPLRAMAWAGAALSCNFDLPANWLAANRDDFDETEKRSVADEAYEQILEEAKKWQHEIYRHFAPLYPLKD